MSHRILGASAAALILGVSAVAIAQSGGDVRSNDRKTEKALDHEKLTPIRPIRRVGPEDWPTGNPNNRADNLNKPKETTGQAAQDSKQEQAKQPAPEPPKQEQAKEEPPKPQPAQQNTAQQQQPAPAAQQPQQAQQAQSSSQPQQSNGQPQANAPAQQQQKSDNFASIRLGTDAQGKVAINEAQEKQIVTALKRQRIRSTDVSVKLGAPPPPDVRLGSVSADIVAVLPQFRGYSFFTTREELVIVEPADKKVVAVVPLSATQTASRPERDRSNESAERTDRSNERAERSDRSAERSDRSTERTERSASRSSSRRESKRETAGAGIPSEEEILNAPVTGSGRATTRIEPADEGTVVIERRHHRPRVLGIFRF